jgi:hypothetical protein
MNTPEYSAAQNPCGNIGTSVAAGSTPERRRAAAHTTVAIQATTKTPSSTSGSTADSGQADGPEVDTPAALACTVLTHSAGPTMNVAVSTARNIANAAQPATRRARRIVRVETLMTLA